MEKRESNITVMKAQSIFLKLMQEHGSLFNAGLYSTRNF